MMDALDIMVSNLSTLSIPFCWRVSPLARNGATG